MKFNGASVKVLMVICLLQMLPPTSVEGNAHFFADTVYREQIVLHFDKPYYLTGETLWYKVYCTNQDGQLSNLSAVLYLELLDDQQQPVVQMRTSLDAGTSNGQIPISSAWSTGSYTLRAYTAWMRNFGPDSFTYQSVPIFNPLSVLTTSVGPTDQNEAASSGPSGTGDHLSISTDKQVYALRKPVKVSISPNLPGKSLNNLSLSVYPYHPSLENSGGLGTTYTHPNELGGSVPDQMQYYPERVGPIFYGIKSNESTPNEDLLVSTGGEGARVYEPISIAAGRFVFQLSKKANQEDVYIWNMGSEETQVTIDSIYDVRSKKLINNHLSLDSSAVTFIENQSVNMQISNLYQEYINIQGKAASSDYRQVPFYGTPDFHYELDEYTRFPDLHEVFVEFVKYVAPRRRDGSLKMFVWDYYSNAQSLANNIFFDQAALVLLDGIPVNDIDLLMEVDPLRIKSIDVITRSYHVGSKVFHGIVALNSYKQDFKGSEPFFKLSQFSSSGFAKPQQFNHPVYGNGSANHRIPDRRNTLYWNPNFEIHDQATQVMFYTADSEGTYQILIRGFTESGEPIHHSSLITVQSTNTP